MDRKTNRFFILVAACSVAGAVVGGTSNWIESQQCLLAPNVTSECVTQDPVTKTIQGMSIGLLAGAGAAVGATWQLKRQQ